MLSAVERLALDRQDATFLPLPLRMGPEPHSMAAHLRQLVRLLRGSGTSPCQDAVRYLTALYDRSIESRPGIACRKGCSHCCVQTVLVTAAEAFAVTAQYRGHNIDFGASRALGEPRTAWRPCVLLDGQGACMVYPSRPLACHNFVSFDLQMCIGFFDRKEDVDFASSANHAQMLYLCRMMLCAAHAIAGLGDQPGYELGAAVKAILAVPDAEARWLAGEDILASVPFGPPIPPSYAQEIARMAAFVGPTCEIPQISA